MPVTAHPHPRMTLSITRGAGSPVDYVQISGDVDLVDEHALDLAAQQLAVADASLIYVDLGGVTFMGTTLVAFLVHIGDTGGLTHRPLILCRPTPMGRKVIYLTRLDERAGIRADLPPGWPHRTSAAPPATDRRTVDR